jgi:hypothetical protein
VTLTEDGSIAVDLEDPAQQERVELVFREAAEDDVPRARRAGSMKRAASLSLVLVLAACTGGSEAPPTRAEPTRSDGEIQILAHLECCYIEGAFFFVLVLDDEGNPVVQRHYKVIDRAVVIRRPVPPGSYSLLAWTIGCPPSGCEPGSAGELMADPPKDVCRSALGVSAGETVTASVRETTGSETTGCDLVIS